MSASTNSAGVLLEAAATMPGRSSIFEELLGSTHPNTLTVRGNLEAIQQSIAKPPSL